MAGTLFVVATPIGNLEDISARALRVLREVAVIAAEDTRHTSHLLQRFGITTRTISYHEHSERGKAEAIVQRLSAGESVAVVSDAGTPTLSDPGAHLVRLAHAAGIRVEPIPGPSAVVAALSAAGFAADGFIFLGFPPTKPGARSAWFERLRNAASVVPLAVFFEAPHRIGQTTEEIRAVFGDVEICIGRELTKAHERVEVLRLSEFSPEATRGEYTVVINFGESTKNNALPVPEPSEMMREFGLLTANNHCSRRQAIARLSRRYGISSRRVYADLEAAKKSGV